MGYKTETHRHRQQLRCLPEGRGVERVVKGKGGPNIWSGKMI